jgi:putative phosphoribosyl transferase
MFLFKNRSEAGIYLAHEIFKKQIFEPILLAINPGGVPVANTIAHELKLSFEVIMTRLLVMPGHDEYVIGAIAEEDNPVVSFDTNFSDPRMLELIVQEKKEIQRSIDLFRPQKNLPKIKNQNVILINDIFFEDFELVAAAKYLKKRGAKKVSVAVPIAYKAFDDRPFIDEIIFVEEIKYIQDPHIFFEDFSPVTDREILECLDRLDVSGETYLGLS